MKELTCRHCGIPLVTKQTKRTPEQLKKQYYYSAYYYCPRCGRMYFDDQFKVENQQDNLFTKHHIASSDPVDIEIWTDGACTNNGKENAKAAWAYVSGKYEAAGLVDGKQTNNRAEAQAILEALRWAAEKNFRKIKILADTQITIHSLKKDLSQIKANTDIFEKIFAVIEENNLEVVYEKVLGHSGVEQNERVDKLANTLASS